MRHDQHRCACDHERVRFCRTCRTVYCLDCAQEWGARPFVWPYVQYQLYGTYPIPYVQYQSYPFQAGSLDSFRATDVPAIETTCAQHGGQT